jgi:hypothetical protein
MPQARGKKVERGSEAGFSSLHDNVEQEVKQATAARDTRKLQSIVEM